MTLNDIDLVVNVLYVTLLADHLDDGSVNITLYTTHSYRKPSKWSDVELE